MSDCVTLTYSGVMDCHHLVDNLAAGLEDGGEVQHGEDADRVPGKDNKIIQTT